MENGNLPAVAVNPPAIPPRPFIDQPLYTTHQQFPYQPQPYNQSYGYGAGLYNYGQQTSNYLYHNNMNNNVNSQSLNFIRIAEESSRGAFQSLDSVVNAIVSVSNMLNTTHSAVFNSFKALVGVVEQFKTLKHFLISNIFFTLLHWIRFLWRKTLALLGLRPRNYAASSESVWNNISRRKEDFNYASLIFWLIAIGGPILIYKCISQILLGEAKSNRWAKGMDEHYTAQAQYDFNGSNPSELSFSAFDMLRIAPKCKQPNIKDWLLASSFDGSNIGLVPINYVKLLSRTNQTEEIGENLNQN